MSPRNRLWEGNMLKNNLKIWVQNALNTVKELLLCNPRVKHSIVL
jgi:hypothetical protein